MLLVLAGLSCAGQKEAIVVRQPAVAGQFYPAEPETLRMMVDRMLADAEPPELNGKIEGVQVPHAGYPYSGPTAANAYKLLSGKDSVTVVMLGPSHRVLVRNAAVYAKGSWRTPLGDVSVDAELAKKILAADDYFADMPEAHKEEHSLEVQLPFLQRVLSHFKIVPIMLLQPTWQQCERVGKAIARAAQGRKVILLASTDLYHGYDYDEARRTDSTTMGLIAGFDPEALYQKLHQGKAQACGGDPVVCAMIAARELGADRAVVLHTTNSNDVMGEKGGYCVGYSATAFVASEKGLGYVPHSDELTEEEKKSLLEIARNTVESYVRTGKIPETKPLTAKLSEKRGVFVTLHKKGELRGCIGYVEAVKPVYQAVSEMAVAASTEDPRFPRVGAAELKDIDIEITVLSPLSRITDPQSVVVGTHGLVMRRGGRSGLLLPQVPVEQGWNRQEFLEYTCLKAGLPKDAWKDKATEIFVFTGQVFGERKH